MVTDEEDRAGVRDVGLAEESEAVAKGEPDNAERVAEVPPDDAVDRVAGLALFEIAEHGEGFVSDASLLLSVGVGDVINLKVDAVTDVLF